MHPDLHTVSVLMILAGSVLMILNIWRYVGFTRRMRWMTEGRRSRLVLYVPLALLLLFLLGYLTTAFFGSPNLVTAGILLGGSVFVLIILSILYYIVDRVAENERQLFAAHEAGKARTAFFFNMSHDLRTPMNAILGYTQLARRPDTDAEQMRGYLDKIHASSQHLLALINDVLEMSRIENGRLELRPAPTDLHQVMRETEDLFSTQMPEMDGYAATRAIRALPDARREIPIIAMTANAFREDVEAERAAGMDAHVSKPLDVREMIQTLIRVLNLKTE